MHRRRVGWQAQHTQLRMHAGCAVVRARGWQPCPQIARPQHASLPGRVQRGWAGADTLPIAAACRPGTDTAHLLRPVNRLLGRLLVQRLQLGKRIAALQARQLLGIDRSCGLAGRRDGNAAAPAATRTRSHGTGPPGGCAGGAGEQHCVVGQLAPLGEGCAGRCRS